MEQIYFSQRFPCNVIFLKKHPSSNPPILYPHRFAKDPIARLNRTKLPYLSRPRSIREKNSVCCARRRRNHLHRTRPISFELSANPVHIHAHIHKQGITRFNNHVPSTDHILSPRRPLASVTPTPNHPFPLSLSLAMHAHRKHHQLGGRVS